MWNWVAAQRSILFELRRGNLGGAADAR